MSIVEKALSKLQSTQPRLELRSRRPGPSPSPGEVRSSAGSPANPTVARHAPLAPAVEARPRRRTTIDLERLRAAGVLPPQNLVQDLTNQFRRLKWPVLDAAFGRSTASLERGNLVMVGSAMPNEGKTFTVLNLALNISLERDCSVVLVDADVTKSHASRLLGVQNERGLIDLLQDGQGMLSDAVIDTDIDGLGIVPSGRASAHAPELLASRRMEELLVGESSRYPDRIFLFDSSPVLATNEAQVLARLVGQVLLVVRAAETPQSAVQDALALLQGSRSIACVLNDVQGGLGSEYYSYEYYGHEREPGT